MIELFFFLFERNEATNKNAPSFFPGYPINLKCLKQTACYFSKYGDF